jgi:hypothetical protein
MNRTHPGLWTFGVAGLVGGVVLTAIGVVGAGEIGSLAGGYGVLMIGAAAYLMIGLKLRARLGRRTPAVATSTAISARS